MILLAKKMNFSQPIHQIFHIFFPLIFPIIHWETQQVPCCLANTAEAENTSDNLTTCPRPQLILKTTRYQRAKSINCWNNNIIEKKEERLTQPKSKHKLRLNRCTSKYLPIHTNSQLGANQIKSNCNPKRFRAKNTHTVSVGAEVVVDDDDGDDDVLTT